MIICSIINKMYFPLTPIMYVPIVLSRIKKPYLNKFIPFWKKQVLIKLIARESFRNIRKWR